MTTHTDETRAAPAVPEKVIGRLLLTSRELSNGAAKPPLAVFCHEPPDSYIGGHVARVVPELGRRGRVVHLFTRQPFPTAENVRVHDVGASGEGDVVAQARDYSGRAVNAFMRVIPAGTAAGVIAYEWTAAPALALLRGLRGQGGALSLHTLERQRSDGQSDIARQIADLEREGLEAAEAVLVHDGATAEAARQAVPDCAGRLAQAPTLFDAAAFPDLDPGAIKARYHVGPLDPVLLFVGDLEERYGADLILKAMPALLRHHPQARLIVVGDGSQLWPLKVYARYLLLDYAVRFVGDVQGQALRELIRASDIMLVPSRESTPWWPVQAAWAAGRPVVATHDAARGLTEHEKDSVLIYPSENSVVWGVERVLYDAELRQAIGAAGRRKVEARFGWPALAEQVESLVMAKVEA